MANRTKDFALKLQFIDYAFLDGITDPADKVTAGDSIPVDRMKAFNALYVENPGELSNPFVSPIAAGPELLKGLPPALVVSAAQDCFHKENENYAMMLVAAGVEVTLKRFLNSAHGFVVHCRGEYAAAHDFICESLKKAFIVSQP